MRRRRWGFSAALTVIAAVLLTAVVRGFVVDVYTVDQVSMQPTLDDDERILVDKSYPDDAGPRSGDIVVFDGTGSFAPYEGTSSLAVQLVERAGHWFGLGSPPQTYVKRVIGVGGDRVVCCDDVGRLSVNGEAVEEPYLAAGPTEAEPASRIEFDVEVPAGRMWVMGDHRAESVDSRSLLGAPGGGMISEDRIIGRATGVFWPWEARRDLEEADDGQR